jgi:chloramphenicol-sensitive protein RarD
MAALGVAYLTAATGGVPWISLLLAVTFGTYGLIRKVVAVDAVPGLATETLLLAPIALGWLLWCEHAGSGALGHAGAPINALLIGSGLVTALPLALFAYGARRVQLSTLGLVQYVGPTLQFLIGVLVFGEAFSHVRAIGFVIIWSALVIYVADSLWRNRRALGV